MDLKYLHTLSRGFKIYWACRKYSEDICYGVKVMEYYENFDSKH
jgi:hypothetical protein